MNRYSNIFRPTLFLGVLLAVSIQPAFSGDWPMYRYDAGRGAASPEKLTLPFSVRWTLQLPASRPAWPASQTKLQFDRSYEPIAAAGKLFVGSTVNDTVTAFDTGTGNELWRFYTNGPVRFAPVFHRNRIYAISDDGYLYCLDAKNGKLVWKYNGGPSDRLILGNDRLISSWPARGAPVIYDDTVYFAASLWPSMGIFIHAVDAQTGKRIWLNSGTGSTFMIHPHNTPSFGSIVPQGYLAATEKWLIVPGGRSTPAVFHRKTGELVQFRFDGKRGGDMVQARGDNYFIDGARYNAQDGRRMAESRPSILTDSLAIESRRGRFLATRIEGKLVTTKTRDRRGNAQIKTRFEVPQVWNFIIPNMAPQTPYLLAGNLLFSAEKGRIAAFDISDATQKKGIVSPVWTAKVESEVWNMIAADGQLFVVTLAGKIICFGNIDNSTPAIHHPLSRSNSNDRRENRRSEEAQEILRLTNQNEGYAIVLGLSDGELVRAFTETDSSNLHLVAVDADRQKVESLRRKWDAIRPGFYGNRVSARVGTPGTSPFPPYMANLIVSEDIPRSGLNNLENFTQTVFRTLRPYGGTACLRLTDAEHATLRNTIEKLALKNAKLERKGNWSLLTKVGALPDSADWTHQYGDATNSVVSKDKTVKTPLGVLWFGGPANDRILPRHGHGPSPQVAGGRLVIEGPNLLRAVDVYTGRLLWEKQLPGIGSYFNTFLHAAGAGEIGSNYVTMEDAVYVIHGRKLFELDSITGKTKKVFSPNQPMQSVLPYWGFLAVSQRYLVATSSPVVVRKTRSQRQFETTRYSTASKTLIVFDRHTGKELWSRTAKFNFRHNCIVVGDGKLFCIDGISPQKRAKLIRRGIRTDDAGRLMALDLETGQEIWQVPRDVDGTFLNYSMQYDVLLQAGSFYRDRASDEVRKGMVAYRGRNGQVLWKKPELKHNGPCLLWKDKIITNGSGGFMLELLTGKRTGWSFSRMYGCNTAVGSENLLTFRSGSAGVCDLNGDSGTGNLGGFRSSCTSNLIVANGVLNAPEYTRTCNCAYQNQTSLAFISMPEAEFWTFNKKNSDTVSFEKLGINLGAPGDRRADNGTMWYEFPTVGGPTPTIAIETEPKKVQTIKQHISLTSGDGLKWVNSSAVKGVRQIRIARPSRNSQGTFTVRLHFAELENVKPGERVFSVSILNDKKMNHFDIVKTAGKPFRGIVREFRGIALKDHLTVTFTTEANSLPVLVSGIEIVREK